MTSETHVCLCVELCASRSAPSANNLRKKGQISEFSTVFVHTKYTSNMAACCFNYVTDVTAPHVYTAEGGPE